jgi:uncharacterized protein YciI
MFERVSPDSPWSNRGMDLFAVHYEYDGRSAERDAIRSEHLAYLDSLVSSGDLIAYGRYRDDGPPGALFIYEASGPDSVEGLVARDPYVAGGFVPLHSVRLWPALVFPGRDRR